MSGTSFAGPICGAPYEYYLAVEYLKKAREEVGYSDYEAALEYAREARKYAQLAREITVNSSGGSGR
ncbi:MAG: DUF4398 domain-containing protein [Deltaproteobacteria bacterium]|nr:DUF4398 domain-containing protein [Deltaproteobacteria bacterium]